MGVSAGRALIVPGEVIGADLIGHISRLAAAGVALDSTRGELPRLIYAKERDPLCSVDKRRKM